VQAALREAQAQAQLARAEADVHAKGAAMAMQAWRALSACTTNLRLPSGSETLRCESAALAPRFALFRAGRARP
jgi:regulator of protease activity HflC (stomatin/prohibitin superfamily)